MLHAFLQHVSQLIPRHQRIQRKVSSVALWEPFSRTGTEGKSVRPAQQKLTLCISSHGTSCSSALGTSWSFFYKELALDCRAYYLGIPTTKFLPFTGSQMATFIHCCIFGNELCRTQAVFAGGQLPYLCIG